MDDPVVRELTQGEVVSNVTTRTVQPARPELSANEVGALRARRERRIVGAPSVLTVEAARYLEHPAKAHCQQLWRRSRLRCFSLSTTKRGKK